MGSPIFGTIAEIYIQFLEKLYIKQWLDSKQILYYKRYVDDILIIYHQNKTNEHDILNQANNIDKHLQFKHSTEENSIINYLDLTICRNNNNIEMGIYRKPNSTDTTIHFTSNHPYEHKLAAFNHYINRMLTLPITKQFQQQEWKTIQIIARNNGFPIHIIRNLKKKLEDKKQKQQQQNPLTPTIQHKKKWVTFTYHSSLIRKITNLFKHSNLRIALRTTNTTFQQLIEKPILNNPSGIYKLKCNTCNRAYIGQSGRSIAIRHKEHLRYIRTNNSNSAYALHILNNRHEYGTAEETLVLLKSCQKSTRMNWWETFYIQLFHQHDTLINEQQVYNVNPLYAIANTTRTPLYTT
jgi:hypothetical protein